MSISIKTKITIVAKLAHTVIFQNHSYLLRFHASFLCIPCRSVVYDKFL